MSKHPWVLVAPWYRWKRAGVPSSGRGTAPGFQKFASDRFVNDFIADPQHSLRFDSSVDVVQQVTFTPAPPPVAAALADKISSLFPGGADANSPPSLTSLSSTGIRKIYLDTHSRHYLVVCELHCDVAGFPSPDTREVCQAGLVVRRRWLSYPESASHQARSIVKNLVAVNAAIAEHLGAGCGHCRSLTARLRGLFGFSKPSLAELETKRTELRVDLEEWRNDSGAHRVLEGWVPGAQERIGAWQVVEDEPQDLVEHVFPMWPLFADPANPDHDATGRAIFFGVLPTASFDTDTSGKARFDAENRYEIRCFVRRHDPRCPRGEAPDCRGEVVWSKATEGYQLAPQFDLQGTSNRPVTIQMPNLAELAAQATDTPVGRFSPVKFVQPQTLAPKVEDHVCTSGSINGPSNCFVAIPLLMIVALFLFNLFLPIVVFIFGLWFLLAFKICIPPRIAFDLELEHQLDELARLGVDLDADDFETVVDGHTVTPESLHKDLKDALAAGYSAAFGLELDEAKAKLSRYSNAPLADLADISRAIDDLPDDLASDLGVRGDLSADLEFEPRRTPEEATQ